MPPVKSVSVTIQCPADVVSAIDEIAAAETISRAAVIRRALLSKFAVSRTQREQ